MRFEVLGEVEVTDDGDRVDLGGPRQRLLLAVLLASADRAASVDRLTEALWDGEEPPERPSRPIQTYVSRLRAAIGAERVVTATSGYRLQLADGDEVDADVVGELIERARRQRAVGEPARAAETLRVAEGIGSGRPFGDLGDRFWAVAVARELADRRALAEEEHAACLLDLGDPAGALASISPMIDEHPLREGLRRAQMVALHRLGRNVDALRAFQEFRTRLIDETGLEPPDGLVALEGQLLRDEPLVDAAGATVAGYELVERLATGRCTTVWRGRRASLDLDVAVKIVDADRADDAQLVRSFERRSQVVAQRPHPGVAPLLDAWRDHRGAFVVQPLLRPVDAVARRRGVTVGAIRRMLVEVSAGIGQLHDAGVVLGGVDIGDLLVDDDGRVVLGSLGLGADAASDGADDLVSLLDVAVELSRSVEQVDTGLVHALDELRSVPPTELDADRIAAAVSSAGGAARHVVRNPYKGLRAFGLADADDFFGRKDVVDGVLERCRSARLTVVVGPSGSGKSSLVRSGVLPRLVDLAGVGERATFAVSMVPGTDPFDALETALSSVAVEAPATLLTGLSDGTASLSEVTAAALPDPDGELLVVIDQFEELWTLTSDGTRERFLTMLRGSIEDPDGRIGVLATIRADLYDRPLAEPHLGAWLADATVPLPAMSPAQLEEVVVGPARRVGLSFAPGVVAALVQAGSNGPGSLPVLQFALTELVEHRESDHVDHGDLERIGGVGGSIARRAESIHESLSDDGRRAARSVFGRLVTFAAGSPTRRRVPLDELPDADSHEVVERFAAARLLSYDRDHETRTPTVEVSHESLLTEWPRLRRWLIDDADDLRVAERVRDATDRWEHNDEDVGDLLTGSLLELSSSLRERRPELLGERDHRLVAESERRREERVAAERRSARRLRGLLVASVLLLVAAVVAGAVALAQRNDAQSTAYETETARLASDAVTYAESDPSLALLVAAEAHRRSPSAETLGGLQRVMVRLGPLLAVREHGREIRATAMVGQDALVVATADTLELVTDPPVEPRPTTSIDVSHEPLVASGLLRLPLAVSRDGARIAVVGDGPSVRVLDGSTLSDRLRLELGSPVRSLAFAPDGRELLVGTADGGITVFDASSGARRSGWTAHGPGWTDDDAFYRDVIEGRPEYFSLPLEERDYYAYSTHGTTAIAVTEDRVVSTGGGTLSVTTRDGSVLFDDLSGPAVPNDAGYDLSERHLAIPRMLAVDLADPEHIAVAGIDHVGIVDVEEGGVEWVDRDPTPFLWTFIETEVLVDVIVDGDVIWTISTDGVLRRVDSSVLRPTYTRSQLPLGTGFSLTASEPGTALVGTSEGIATIALDGRTLMSDAVPFVVSDGVPTVLPRLSASIGGDTIAVADTLLGRSQLYRRTADGYVPLVDHVTDDSAVVLSDPQNHVGDEVSEYEDRANGRYVRALDPETFEPLGRWVPDVGPTASRPGGTVRWTLPRSEIAGLDPGVQRVVAHDWPSGRPHGESIEFVDETSGRGLTAAIVTGDDQTLIGTSSTQSGEPWALDLTTGELMDPPLLANEGVSRIRWGPDGERWYVVRSDGSVDERDPATSGLIRNVIGGDTPVAGDDAAVFVDPTRDLWLATGGLQPRLLDASAGTTIGGPFPHDHTDVVAQGADGVDGEHLQLLTVVGEHVHIWNLDTDTWFDLACEAAGRNLAVEEWERVGPRDADPAATCERWPAPA